MEEQHGLTCFKSIIWLHCGEQTAMGRCGTSGSRKPSWEMMVIWTQVIVVKVGKSGQILILF